MRADPPDGMVARAETTVACFSAGPPLLQTHWSVGSKGVTTEVTWIDVPSGAIPIAASWVRGCRMAGS
jgi:hypothetical protein